MRHRRTPMTAPRSTNPRQKSKPRSTSRATTPSGRGTPRRRRPRSARGRASASPARDAISVLRADHARVSSLLTRLQRATGELRRTALLDEIERALREHTGIEEQIFYPAFREAARTDKDRRLFHEATEEHHVVDVVLPEVRAARHEPDVFQARAKVLRELVRHHIEEEQDELFPRARQLLSGEELRALGTQISERKRAHQRPSGALDKVGALIGLTMTPS